MSIIVIIILILFGWMGFASGPTAEPVENPTICTVTEDGGSCEGTAWTPVEIGDIEGVIVAETDGPQFIGADGYWTPSVEDVTAVEDAIADEQGELDQMRQYLGYVVDGERKIFVNGFCDDWDTDWRSEPVIVFDGGDWYFTAVYNMEIDELETFSFNGEA